MEQQIRFATASDGVSIAYATVGSGPPLVKAPNWMSHLEYEWRSPIWRHWWEELAKDHLLIRFDQRGCGLSDWLVEDLSLEARVSDIECVVDAVGLDRFVLLGISQGGAMAAAYAARHPDKVTQLILYGSYSLGFAKRGETPEAREEREARNTLMRLGWGRDDPTYRQIFTSAFIPDATAEQMGWFNELQRVSSSPESAYQITNANAEIDVRDDLPNVQAPTLVLHSRGDLLVPFDLGRRLAAMIPNAEFVPLESNNHLLLESEPAWPRFLSEFRRFTGVPSKANTSLAEPAIETSSVTTHVSGAGQHDDQMLEEARFLIAELDEIDLTRFDVVRGYSKYEEVPRNILKDARQKITEGLEIPGRRRENHLIWASPGSGKTYFVERVFAMQTSPVDYLELNLAKSTQAEFQSALRGLDETDGSWLCLVDEVDAQPEATWPYEMLLPYLDASIDSARKLVFVLAGSSGSSVDEMKRRIASRAKGVDLLSRIPRANEYEIPAMSVGDRILVALTQFRRAGAESGKDARSVEKLGLYYIAVSPHLANARQLRELAVRAVDRMPPGEDRIKYDHLFSAGDPDNKGFWMRSTEVSGALENRFVSVKD